MAERTDLLRVALAQINPTVGDIRGNARKISDYIARARDEGAALVVFPELALTGYPPEDLLLKTSFLDAARTALRELADRGEGHRRDGRLPGAGRGRLQHRGRARRRRRCRRLPQDVPAELRSVRRAALLPVGRGGRDRRGERRADRHQRVRGHLGARPAGDERGARGRAGDREPVGLAVPGRLRRPARADAHPARRRLPRGGRVREHGRRAGRAGLRRPQPRHRPGRPRDRPRAPVRGVAHALHDRPARDRRGAATRHAPPRERAAPAPRRPDRGAAGVHACDARDRAVGGPS